jgi:thioredoxin reductase (NADPH)
LTVPDREIAIIGGGVAGATAGLFAARNGRDVVILNGGLPGGQLLNISAIEDFPGFPEGVAGFDLCPSVQDQAMSAGAAFEMADVTSLSQSGGAWSMTTPAGELSAGAVVVASGSRPRTLGLDREEELTGRGISHCASCDGPLYRGQVVGVVGGGDSALQEAIELTGHVDQVVLFHRGPAFSGQSTYETRVLGNSKIVVRFSTVVDEILGAAAVEGVRCRATSGGDAEDVKLGGLFVYVGSEPNSSFLPAELALDHHGRIPTDARMRTALGGLLAAGDIRSESAAQAVAAAGDGATAAVTAHRYLAGEPWPGSLG